MYDVDGGEVVCVMSLSQPSGAGGEGQPRLTTSTMLTTNGTSSGMITVMNMTRREKSDVE